MVSVYLFPLIVAVITIGGFEAGAIQIGCSDQEERCLPIRHCLPMYTRVVKQEHKQNITFRNELNSKMCQPEDRKENKTYICCPKPDIECRLNGEPGACLLRKNCPTLESTTEEQLMDSFEQNLCYVHEKKNYFCCTDPICASIKKLCDQQPSPKRTISAFPNCTSSSGKVGSYVPRKLCGDQTRSVTYTANRKVCCVPPNSDHLISHSNAAKLAQSSCGTVGLMNKIQNGTFAERGEFPWMASLVYKSKASCSGTLIHPRYVLTAGHCINVKLVKVKLGKHDLRGTSHDEVQEINIMKMFRHGEFDVGLLRLVKPATVDGELVRPICLPIYSSLRMYLPTTVTITGWGKTEKNKPSNVLLKANMTVQMSEEFCRKDHMICVDDVNRSNLCVANSGGPYQAPGLFGGHSRYVQYGIISDGPPHCSQPDRPSRGILVGYVIDWILDQMQLYTDE